jgi:hypothetical protein
MNNWQKLGEKLDLAFNTNYCRFINHTLGVKNIPIKFIDGDSNPVKTGNAGYYTTITGIFIRNPSAYRNKSFGGKNMVYHQDTREITVGKDWLKKIKSTPRKGYKATYNYFCFGGFKYEVGKTYSMECFPTICEKGFHYCKIAKDVFNYYPANNDLVLLEVEDLGVSVTQGNKTATNQIRILREIKDSKELDELFGNKYEIYYVS